MKSLANAAFRSELVARLERVRSDAPRRWGRMTAPQMICHLNDSFRCVMGDTPIEIPRGLSLWPVLKYVALYAPMHWPKGVPTRPELDQCAGAGTPPAQFDSDVCCLLDTMDRFSRRPRGFEFRPHPMFKVMTEAQWMRWGYLHVDHHLRQFGE